MLVLYPARRTMALGGPRLNIMGEPALFPVLARPLLRPVPTQRSLRRLPIALSREDSRFAWFTIITTWWRITLRNGITEWNAWNIISSSILAFPGTLSGPCGGLRFPFVRLLLPRLRRLGVFRTNFLQDLLLPRAVDD